MAEKENFPGVGSPSKNPPSTSLQHSLLGWLGGASGVGEPGTARGSGAGRRPEPGTASGPGASGHPEPGSSESSPGRRGNPSKQAGEDPPLPPAHSTDPSHEDLKEDHSPQGDPQQSSATKDETIPQKTKTKTKLQNKPKKINNLNAMFGPQSEMWTKFFTLTFKEEKTPRNGFF